MGERNTQRRPYNYPSYCLKRGFPGHSAERGTGGNPAD